MKEVLLVTTMYIVTVCTYVSYVPQVVKLLRTKKSEDLSIASWILWTVSSLANLVYSIVLDRFELILASISEFMLIALTLILTLYYEYKNNYYLESEVSFQAKLDKIQMKDGNHMILVSAMLQDRERRKENRSKFKLLCKR